MKEKIKRIAAKMVRLSASYSHPDPVARIYSVHMDVGLELIQEMLRIRENERKGEVIDGKP